MQPLRHAARRGQHLQLPAPVPLASAGISARTEIVRACVALQARHCKVNDSESETRVDKIEVKGSWVEAPAVRGWQGAGHSVAPHSSKLICKQHTEGGASVISEEPSRMREARPAQAPVQSAAPTGYCEPHPTATAPNRIPAPSPPSPPTHAVAKLGVEHRLQLRHLALDRPDVALQPPDRILRIVQRCTGGGAAGAAGAVGARWLS